MTPQDADEVRVTREQPGKIVGQVATSDGDHRDGQHEKPLPLERRSRWRWHHPGWQALIVAVAVPGREEAPPRTETRPGRDAGYAEHGDAGRKEEGQACPIGRLVVGLLHDPDDEADGKADDDVDPADPVGRDVERRIGLVGVGLAGDEGARLTYCCLPSSLHVRTDLAYFLWLR